MDPVTRDVRFRQAVDDHMGILLKTAHGFAANPADRDDLLQEILLAVWQALDGYNAHCQFSTFLYRVAHNRALNWHRTRVRYARKIEHATQQPHLVLSSEGLDGPDPKLEWLYAIIHRLPPLDRTLIMLQLDGLSLREIADVTGLSDSNVGVRLHRIKHALASTTSENFHEL